MGVLEEIGSKATNAADALREAQTLVEAASQISLDLEQSAAAHGWSGIAEAMNAAQEATDHTLTAIDSSLTATTEGLTALAVITQDLSKTEVAGKLANIQDRFKSAQDAALAAGNALDDAKTGAQQTDAQQLLDLLDSAEAHLDEARRVLESATEDAATEQSAAEAWGKGTGRDAAAGAPSPPSARAAGGSGSPSGPGSQAAKPSQDQRVADVLKRKKGSIKNAPLGGGSPSWDDFSKMTMRDIEAGARANKPGYKTALKLLRDRRFNR